MPWSMNSMSRRLAVGPTARRIHHGVRSTRVCRHAWVTRLVRRHKACPRGGRSGRSAPDAVIAGLSIVVVALGPDTSGRQALSLAEAPLDVGLLLMSSIATLLS